jgi:FixJ family two-component response regulator
MGKCEILETDVLVVDSLNRQRRKIGFLLRAAGYRVALADGFESASRFFDSRPTTAAVTCLVTSVRLGPYNGLHLIARTHHVRPNMAAILTHHVFDPVLESDARANGALFLVLPCPTPVLTDAVKHLIANPSKAIDPSISQRKVGAGEDSNASAGQEFRLTSGRATV